MGKRKYINQNHINAWQAIQEKAEKKADDAKSHFNSQAIWIPIGVAAGLSIISAASGGLIPTIILGAGTLYAMGEAHIISYREECFYRSMAETASKTKRLIETEKLSGYGVIPDFEEEKEAFIRTYKRPSFLKSVFSPRATIIAVTVCASATALAPKDTMDSIPWFHRKDEIKDSPLALQSSPRPRPRP